MIDYRVGDAKSVLMTLPGESVHCCVTSPPYWRLRSYHVDGQLGLENTMEEYINNLIAVFQEVRRVLRKDGTLWLNLGDTYISKRNLAGIPWRVALALQDDGWNLYAENIWYKPNGMPSSVKDRFSNKWEYLYLFSKSKKYYFDLDAVREAYLQPEKLYSSNIDNHKTKDIKSRTTEGLHDGREDYKHPLGKNPGDVFIISTQPFPEAHFAVFPEKLCEKPIKAGCPEGGIVLDPFCGAGTTCYVAKEMGRKYIGIDISEKYVAMAEKRNAQGVL